MSPWRAEQGPAVRGGHLRADRGHPGHAQRDGHQRRRGRGGRGRGRRAEAADEAEEEEGGELVEAAHARSAKVERAEPTDRTDDPVRMYLREMGSVELLSREGEIAIAKRIEAGRDTMIRGPVREPADLPGHHHLARRARRRQDPAARHHRPRSRPMRGPEAPRAPPSPSRPRRDGRRSAARRAPARGRRRRARQCPRATSSDDDFDERRRSAVAPWKPSCAKVSWRPSTRIADDYKKLPPAAGPALVESSACRATTLSPPRTARTKKLQATSIVTAREDPVAQQQPHRGAGRAALRHQQAPDRPRRPAAAPGRQLRRQPRASS